MIPNRKPRKCANCRYEFIPDRPLQRVCCLGCAVEWGKKQSDKAIAKAKKAERAADRAKLAELLPLQHWLKRAEKAVNAFVRERDREQPCISCGTHDAAEWHAGHWKSVGANSALRFDPSNIHRQCNQCNVFKGGNAGEYEARLPARIGMAEYYRLKHAPRYRKWTREECQAIEREFKQRLKDLQHVELAA